MATIAAGVSPRVWGDAPAIRIGSQPRNIIFLVSDGMSSGTLSMTDQFLRWRDERPSYWFRLYEEGRVNRALMETASRNDIVTDSAAASSAWGCGHRVFNGRLNVGPNGEHLEPIMVTARRKGKATGLITTATISHATPAGFAANMEQRGDEEAICLQYLEREIDLLLGGGTRFFSPERREDARDLLLDFKTAGYAYAGNTDELFARANEAERLLGLFASHHLPYEVDRVNNPERSQNVPSLADMTRAGLQMLSRKPNGFIVQIEAARVDHAAHANDAAGLIFDQIAFDEAIGAAIEFAKNDPDTLVIITTDHGNANPGMSSGADLGARNFRVLNQFKGSHGTLLRRLRDTQTPEEIAQHLADGTGVQLTNEQAEIMLRQLNEAFMTAYNRMSGNSAVLGQLLANHTDIGWIGNAHTSDHVELAVLGPGSEGLKPFVKNTDLHTLMLNALG